MRTIEQGADTIVWLAAVRPKERGFWFDRQIVTEYKMPFTTHSQEEEEKLWETLMRLTDF